MSRDLVVVRPEMPLDEYLVVLEEPDAFLG
jgi:hypothetical protein